IFHFIAEQVDRPVTPVVLAPQSGFDIARGFFLNIWIAETGVVQLVEGRRLERGAVAGDPLQAVSQTQAVGDIAGVVAPELFIVIMAQTQLPFMNTLLSQVLCVVTVINTAILAVRGTTADLIGQMVEAQ